MKIFHFDVSKWETKTAIPGKVIKSISFIPLETSKQCLIGTVGKIVALNDKYYIIDSQYANGVLVFNKEGKYIKNIGKKGRGKGEFLRLNSFCIDEKGKKMLILDSYARKVLLYNLTNGVYLEDIKLNFLPRGIDMVRNQILSILSYGSENGYTITNLNLNDRSYKKYLRMDEYDIVIMNFNSISHSKNTYYAPFLKDIVYQIKEDGVFPAISFNFGEYKVPEDRLRKALKIDNAPQNSGYKNLTKLIHQGNWIYSIGNVIENDQFMTFSLRLKRQNTFVIYSKATNNYYYGSGYDGALNHLWTSITNLTVDGDQFISVVDASKLIGLKKAFMQQNNSEMKERYQNLLNQISFDSNPVIISIEYNEF